MAYSDPWWEITLNSVQQRMLELLKDGREHRREELHSCLTDKLGSLTNICAHLSTIRKVLRPNGQEILCEYAHRTFCYRLVNLVGVAAKKVIETAAEELKQEARREARGKKTKLQKAAKRRRK